MGGKNRTTIVYLRVLIIQIGEKPLFSIRGGSLGNLYIPGRWFFSPAFLHSRKLISGKASVEPQVLELPWQFAAWAFGHLEFQNGGFFSSERHGTWLRNYYPRLSQNNMLICMYIFLGYLNISMYFPNYIYTHIYVCIRG